MAMTRVSLTANTWAEVATSAGDDIVVHGHDNLSVQLYVGASAPSEPAPFVPLLRGVANTVSADSGDKLFLRSPAAGAVTVWT